MPAERRFTAAFASRESLCCVRSLQTLQSVCGTGGRGGGLRNPWRNTHTWEVIESEEMAQGGKGGPSSRNENPVHVKKKVR